MTRIIIAFLLFTSVSYAQLRYAATNQSRDSNMPSISFGGNYFLGGAWKNALDVDFTVAREKNQMGYADLSRYVYGVRTMLSMTPIARLQVNVVLGFSHSNYDSTEPLAPTSNVSKNDNLFNKETTHIFYLHEAVRRSVDSESARLHLYQVSFKPHCPFPYLRPEPSQEGRAIPTFSRLVFLHKMSNLLMKKKNPSIYAGVHINNKRENF